MFFIFSILLIPGCLSANVALTNGKFSHDSWRRHVTMNVNDWQISLYFSTFSNYRYKKKYIWRLCLLYCSTTCIL